MFEEKHPKWREFIDILMKYKQRMLDDAKERIHDLELDEETFWLVISKEIPQLSQNHYIPYQIVYIYVNKVIITPEQRQIACKLAITYLSDLARRLMRSMKYTEIKILSLAKFTAAIDVGIWSDNSRAFADPHEYYKDYENLTLEPSVLFSIHEYNFQQFLDLDYLQTVFTARMLKNQNFKDKLQDMMLTVTTMFIILNRKEEAQYIIERCILI